MALGLAGPGNRRTHPCMLCSTPSSLSTKGARVELIRHPPPSRGECLPQAGSIAGVAGSRPRVPGSGVPWSLSAFYAPRAGAQRPGPCEKEPMRTRSEGPDQQILVGRHWIRAGRSRIWLLSCSPVAIRASVQSSRMEKRRASEKEDRYCGSRLFEPLTAGCHRHSRTSSNGGRGALA